ncbi:hypothetical protein A1Q2_02588 [Trichosporon asahii var. asahii CBS 8904]|uniref:F-box domain-containing protein n=1 Tax=Trichosporon asahii var. asahii (strain CBS 8904) TaxID=1220162 RepID=K1WQ42_TRIAC|nr:hypothetical protein A1Q2_02588 [Trichosporon asahii var. asahii CBS 8904]
MLQHLNVMIDHAYYPHIIDLIFDFAEFDALLAMSRTCREWRDRSRGKIDHVYQFDGMYMCYPFPINRTKALHYCRTLDVAMNPLDEFDSLEDGLELVRRAAPNLDTVRFVDIGCLKMPVWVVPTRRLVYGRFDPNPDLYGFGEPEDDEPCASSVKKVVINHTSDRASCHHFKAEDFSVPTDEVVFIFHGKETCPCCFMAVIRATQIGSVPLTVVGIESLSKQTTIQPYNVRKQKLTRSVGGHRQAKRGVTALTHMEYRQLVGEKEYAMDTNFEKPRQLFRYEAPSFYDRY